MDSGSSESQHEFTTQIASMFDGKVRSPLDEHLVCGLAEAQRQWLCSWCKYSRLTAVVQGTDAGNNAHLDETGRGKTQHKHTSPHNWKRPLALVLLAA